MKQELISIVVPLYNVELYIERCLHSILAQTYENIEVLIIDDKGQDNSANIVREIQQNHNRGGVIKLIEHTHNRGTSAARNTGIDTALGEYLMFVDSDDEVTPDCVEKHYVKINEIDADFTGAMNINRHVVDDSPAQIALKLSQQVDIDFKLMSSDEVKEFYFASKHWRTEVPWNKLYRLSFLRDNDIKCVESHVYDDLTFFFDVINCACRVRFFNDVLYIHYQYPTSLTGFLRSGNANVSKSMTQLCEVVEYQLSYIPRTNNNRCRLGIFNKSLMIYVMFLMNLRRNITHSSDRELMHKAYRLLRNNNYYCRADRVLKIRSWLLTYYPSIYSLGLKLYRVFKVMYFSSTTL